MLQAVGPLVAMCVVIRPITIGANAVFGFTVSVCVAITQSRSTLSRLSATISIH